MVADPEMKRYYQEHRDRFALPEEYTLSQIFLKAATTDDVADLRAKAREIMSQLKQGESFEDLALRITEHGFRAAVPTVDAPFAVRGEDGVILGAFDEQAHPLFGKSFDDPSALASQAFVLTGADEPDVLTAYRTRHGLGLEVAGLSEHLDEAKRLTILGVGICLLPEAFAAPDVEAGRLWPLLRQADQPSTPVFVITNPRAPGKLARQLLLAEIGAQGCVN